MIGLHSLYLITFYEQLSLNLTLLLSSNIKSKQKNQIVIYDSLSKFTNYSNDTMIMFSRFITKLLDIEESTIEFVLPEILPQQGSSDCGFYAVLYCKMLIDGLDPCQMKITQENLRANILNEIQQGSITLNTMTKCNATNVIIFSRSINICLCCKDTLTSDKYLCLECYKFVHITCYNQICQLCQLCTRNSRVT